MSTQYRVKINPDENPTPPSDWHWLVQFVGDPANRYLGGLHDKTAPAFDSDEWLYLKPLYAYVHGGAKLSLEPFSCPFDSGQVGWVGITRKNAVVEGLTAKDLDRAQENVRGFVEDWNSYLAGDTWNVLIYSSDDGEQWEIVESMGGVVGYDYAEQEAQMTIKHLQGKN